MGCSKNLPRVLSIFNNIIIWFNVLHACLFLTTIPMLVSSILSMDIAGIIASIPLCAVLGFDIANIILFRSESNLKFSYIFAGTSLVIALWLMTTGDFSSTILTTSVIFISGPLVHAIYCTIFCICDERIQEQEFLSSPTPAPSKMAKVASPNKSVYDETLALIFEFSTDTLKELDPADQPKDMTNAHLVISTLLLFVASQAVSDPGLSRPFFANLHQVCAATHEEDRYIQAISYYDAFVDVYNNAPKSAVDVFQSWQYHACKLASQKIGGNDYAYTLTLFALLADFLHAFLPEKQAPTNSPPPSAVPRENPASVFKGPDDYVPLYCRKCGSVIPIDSIYCPECGEKVVVLR